MQNLTELRKSIDNIDNAIIAMLAERFKVTQKVGEYKAKNNLPAVDSSREEEQYKRITELGENYGLNPEFAKRFLQTVIDEVVSNHKEIAEQFKGNPNAIKSRIL